MKFLLLSLLLLMAQMTFSATIFHNILEGKMHKGGEIQISIKKKSEESLMAYLKYKLEKKWYVPVPDKVLDGDLTQSLPISFESEDAYLELEENGFSDIKKARLEHLGRADVDGFENCHKIKIIPTNKKWVGILYYHPEIKSLGWVKTELTLLNLPVVGDYLAISKLRN